MNLHFMSLSGLQSSAGVASFAFPNNYFEQVNDIEVNRLGSGRLYDYYRAAWQIETGAIPTTPRMLSAAPIVPAT